MQKVSTESAVVGPCLWLMPVSRTCFSFRLSAYCIIVSLLTDIIAGQMLVFYNFVIPDNSSAIWLMILYHL